MNNSYNKALEINKELVRKILPNTKVFEKNIELIRKVLSKIDFDKIKNNTIEVDKYIAFCEEQLIIFNKLGLDGKKIAKHIKSLLNPEGKNFEELPSIIQNIMDIFFKKDWFITTTTPLEIIKAGESGKIEEYFKINLDSIENNIITKYPERAHIIKSAFEAHREGKYELSVPIILIQADGICKEKAKASFFMSEKKQKKQKISRVQTASYVEKENITNVIDRIFIHVLEEKTNINKTSDESRHAIIHGSCIKYGLEINSLKAISLINYVTETFDNNTE